MRGEIGHGLKLERASSPDRQCRGPKNSNFRHGAVGVQWQVSWFRVAGGRSGRQGSLPHLVLTGLSKVGVHALVDCSSTVAGPLGRGCKSSTRRHVIGAHRKQNGECLGVLGLAAGSCRGDMPRRRQTDDDMVARGINLRAAGRHRHRQAQAQAGSGWETDAA